MSLVIAASHAGEIGGKLENKSIAWQWLLADGKLQAVSLEDKLNGGILKLSGDCFQLILGDGQLVKSSDFTLMGTPELESLTPEPDSPTLARHFGGQELVAHLSAADRHLTAEWHVILRDDGTYLRQQLLLRASGGDVLVKEIVLFDQIVPGAKTVGSVDGSPVVAGNYFLGYEHPMAQNVVNAAQEVRCSYLRNAVLEEGEQLTQSCVLGVVPQGQLRRGFLAYIERERAHPYRPFLHYNTWFDIAWDKRKYTEAEGLDAMAQFNRELVQKRGVQLQSFLLDDGWDDNRTLWKIHGGFPDGFSGVQAAAASMNACIGVWISPFGGYDLARTKRLEYASQFGYETNASGFSLAGPKYYQRFHDICLEMINKYDVNMFKFDGLAAGEKAGEKGLTRDGDAMLRLVGDLRAAKPDIYINQTTGTWPSPFWLCFVDSTYRGGADHDFAGKGTPRQQWITYRDSQTYQNVVLRGPLYPLNSLMLHGIVFAKNAIKLDRTDDQDFADEVHCFFGTGTQLQELYLTPSLLDEKNWNDLAEAANWSRANADVLVDTHWIGGNPAKGDVYGWASWSPRKGIIVLRNPDDKAKQFVADVADILELPADAERTYLATPVWKTPDRASAVKLSAGEPHVFTLQPFEVAVFELTPDLQLLRSTASAVIGPIQQ